MSPCRQPIFLRRFSGFICQGNGNAGQVSNSRVRDHQAGMTSPWTSYAIPRSGVSKQRLVGQMWLPCVIINKTVLAHSILFSLHTVSSCFHAMMEEVSTCNRLRLAKPKVFTIWSLQTSLLILLLVDGYQVWYGAKCPQDHGNTGRTRSRR